MRKKVSKDKLQEYISRLTKAMQESNCFYNIAVTQHKKENFVWVIIG